MKLAARAKSPADWVALGLNLAPAPLVEMMYGMELSRSLIAAARLGVFQRLAQGPATLAELVADCDLNPVPARLLVDMFVVSGHLEKHGEAYDLSRRSRKWLDPESPTSIVALLENGGDMWHWWTELEAVIRTGRSFEVHSFDPDDPHWRRYVYAQYQIARLTAPQVARGLKIPASATSLLDVAGGHGWFSAEICRRHPSLQATVVDLPASAAFGREIIAEAGMADRVEHVDGDALDAPLGGPHDFALCFNLMHHLQPNAIVAIFERIHDALRPGTTLAVLDIFAGDVSEAAAAGRFFYLNSGAETYTAQDLQGWLDSAGFQAPKKVTVPTLLLETLYTARRKS